MDRSAGFLVFRIFGGGVEAGDILGKTSKARGGGRRGEEGQTQPTEAPPPNTQPPTHPPGRDDDAAVLRVALDGRHGARELVDPFARVVRVHVHVLGPEVPPLEAWWVRVGVGRAVSGPTAETTGAGAGLAAYKASTPTRPPNPRNSLARSLTVDRPQVPFLPVREPEAVEVLTGGVPVPDADLLGLEQVRVSLAVVLVGLR